MPSNVSSSAMIRANPSPPPPWLLSTTVQRITAGGSRLHVEWADTGARVSQRPMLFLLHHGLMGRVISRMWAAALDRYAQDDLS